MTGGPGDRLGFSMQRAELKPAAAVALGPWLTWAAVTLLLCSGLAPVACSDARSNNGRSGATAGSGRWAYLVPQSFRAAHLAERLARYDVLCLGVYRLNANGLLVERPRLSSGERALLGRARSGKRLYPLISLRHAGAGRELLRNTNNRRRAVETLLQLVKSERFDGIHIDFEYLKSGDTPDFVLFLKELRRAVRPVDGTASFTLSVAAFPPLFEPREYARFHEPAALAPVVDEIVFMTYDYHQQSPGPVTDLGWAEKNIRMALEHLPKERIWLGVPAYGYEWRTKAPRPGWQRPRAISEAQGQAQCRAYGCVRHSSGMLELKRSGSVAYFSDRELRERMQQLAGRLGVAGTALWRIGFEDFPVK